MEHTKEFSRYANSYDSHTLIQKEVATKLVSMIEGKPQSILDLGCGSGAISKEINFTYENFIGVDNAQNMCALHPKDKKIKVINDNFESNELQKELERYKPFDLIISSSALQWSKDLDSVLRFCKKSSSNILFSLFTDGTFRTIYNMTSQKSFLPSTKDVIDIVSRYYDIEYEIKEYKLNFDDNISKFRYIKRSGVSGGKKRLSVAQTKDLINNYPHKYLEFEVIYIKNK